VIVPTALVVDDTGDIRFLMKVLLAHSGLEVQEAENGDEALAALADGVRPDIVVLDLQMPERDGWETLTSLRALDGTTGIAVVVCSVKAGASDVRRAWELGCDGYIKKPFSNTTFVDEIRAVVARTSDERRTVRAQRLLEARALEAV